MPRNIVKISWQYCRASWANRADIKASKMLEKRIETERQDCRKKSKSSVAGQWRKTSKRLSLSVTGHILNSLSSSDEYKDIEYKHCEAKNTILYQDSSLTSQMRTTFPDVSQACDRTSVSDISTKILILNAALKDMGIINKNDSSKVVDLE
ncbi:hypothetical protein AVEN_82779-1 [Araneus ventricosus]|uniref:Uncharacterized protein n=1 Tax=Araneus ventricosus TaxID=182803 RepID=A0A4Y2DD73_ARAVE|nr:hypothetical protein AVEN_82779-1 [Araneus ventricosus]